MNDQQIIAAEGMPAASLESVLAGIAPGQTLSCQFVESIEKWSCEVWGPAAKWTADLYGTGPTLAAALADLHPPMRMKRARPADPGEWTTDEVSG